MPNKTILTDDSGHWFDNRSAVKFEEDATAMQTKIVKER